MFVTPLYPPEIGGPATYAKLLMDSLPSRGNTVTLVKFSDYKKYPSPIRHFFIFLKIIFSGLRHDVIFAQDVFSVGFPAVCASKIIRKPFIVRVPGDYAWEQGVQNYNVTDSIEVFQNKKYSSAVERMRSVEKYVTRNATSVIAPSKYFARIVDGWRGVASSKKVEAIYNGIDIKKIDQYKKNTYESSGDFKTISSAGRMVPWKEFESLIRLLSSHSDWKLVLIGDGPDKERLIKIAQDIKVSERVVFHKNMTQENLWETLADSDLFVLNSSFESFSYQAVEVMALGVPLVATDACNLSEIIDSGINGVLIPSGNQGILESEVSRFFSDVSYREKIGQAGAIKAQDFEIEKTLTKLLEVLQSSVNKK